MGSHDKLDQSFFTRICQRIHVILKHGFKWLFRFPFRMFWSQLFNAIDGEEQLKV